MTIIRYQPRCVPESTAPFCQVVLDEHYVYLSGLVAADFPNGLGELGDAAAETQAVMTKIRDVLVELDLSLECLVRVDIHLASFDDFDDVNEAYAAFFDPGVWPARTTTESPRLFGGSRVEITAQARRRCSPA